VIFRLGTSTFCPSSLPLCRGRGWCVVGNPDGMAIHDLTSRQKGE
jgi:hypothetical protein